MVQSSVPDSSRHLRCHHRRFQSDICSILFDIFAGTRLRHPSFGRDCLTLRWSDMLSEEAKIAITKRWSRGKDGPTLANVPARRHRESWNAQGDWQVLAFNRAATWSRVRTQIPHIFEVDT